MASDLDVAGVKLDMTIYEAVDVLQANGFDTFSQWSVPPKDDDDLSTPLNQFTLSAKSKTNPGITVQVLFVGSPDKSAKWSMGDAMRAAEIDYGQEIPRADDETTIRAIDTLVGKAEAKYGKTDELVLQPLTPGYPRIAIWGNDTSRSIYSSHESNPNLHFTNEGSALFQNLASSSLLDGYNEQLKHCVQRDPQGRATDDVLDCMKPIWKSEHGEAQKLAPILLAGPFSQVAAPEFDLVLYSPYKELMYQLNSEHQTILAHNKTWHERQAAVKKATGDTAF